LAQAEPARYEADYAFVGIPHADARKAVEFPWDWLRDDRRKLLVTLGTVSRDLEPRFFETVIDAMRQLPQVQAVIVAPDALISKRSTLQPPDNVLLRRYVPQPQLLQRVDGVICHAGHNTVCETLLNGLPLIVSPIRDDQPVVAQQVVAAGAALFLRHGKATPAAVRDAAQRLLTDAQLVDSARRLAQQLRSAPGSAGAADVIEALTAAPVAVRS
jgi:MGT family glycosyltransferase